MSNKENKPDNPGRRAALRRFGMAVVAAYVTPEVVLLSEARASSGVSPPSGVSVATPPTPPSTPSDVDRNVEVDERPRDSCKTATGNENTDTISITESDFNRAQRSVDAGFAKPLEAIWADFTREYSGKIIGVEFTGYQYRPTYRFKAISPSGHLETVVVSARTGKVLRIVGC